MTENEKIQDVLKRCIEPFIQCHGGNVRLVEYRDGVVLVELTGACAGCPSADLGTRAHIEEVLMAELPDVRRVELCQPVSEELMEFARTLLRREEK